MEEIWSFIASHLTSESRGHLEKSFSCPWVPFLGDSFAILDLGLLDAQFPNKLEDFSLHCCATVLLRLGQTTSLENKQTRHFAFWLCRLGPVDGLKGFKKLLGILQAFPNLQHLE